VWETTLEGRRLHFHLAGINNQNFIMRDEETGSWWQQVTGEAILGPLKGRRLRPVFQDELTFGTWKRERPGGRVLRPLPGPENRYAPANWEEEVSKLPVVSPIDPKSPLPPRTVVAGLTFGEESRAYPLTALKRQNPILDRLGDIPLLLALGEDGKSVRAFERLVDGRTFEFFARTDVVPQVLFDSETGSEWNFAGRAVSGPLTGRQLSRAPLLVEYWFDWKAYHPQTSVYLSGLRQK